MQECEPIFIEKQHTPFVVQPATCNRAWYHPKPCSSSLSSCAHLKIYYYEASLLLISCALTPLRLTLVDDVIGGTYPVSDLDE
jgi:hypothetical protein